jgi:hypothetical protein
VTLERLILSQLPFLKGIDKAVQVYFREEQEREGVLNGFLFKH